MAKDIYLSAERTVARELKRRVRREKIATCRYMRKQSREYRAYTKALAKAAFMGDVTDEALKKESERKKRILEYVITDVPVSVVLVAYFVFAFTGMDLPGTGNSVAAFVLRCLAGSVVAVPLILLWVTWGAEWSIDAIRRTRKPIEERVLEVRKRGEVPLVEALQRPAMGHFVQKIDKGIAGATQNLEKTRKEQQLW